MLDDDDSNKVAIDPEDDDTAAVDDPMPQEPTLLAQPMLIPEGAK